MVIKSVESQSVVEPKVVVPVVVPVAVIDNKKSEENKIIEEKPIEAKAYFTIQILADKKPVTITQQKTVYKGTLKVIEHIGDGWYRYSVGRFTAYSDASSTLKSEGIKGYVGAYDGDKRITTSEAKKILGGVK